MKTTVKYIVAFVFNLMVAMSAFAQTPSSRMIPVFGVCGSIPEFHEYMQTQNQKIFLHGENTIINSSGDPIATILIVTLGVTGDYTVAVVDTRGAVCLISRGTNLLPNQE